MNCLYWNLGEPEHSSKSISETEEVTDNTKVSVVGLIHSRGVSRVMPVEFSDTGDTRRDQQFNVER